MTKDLISKSSSHFIWIVALMICGVGAYMILVIMYDAELAVIFLYSLVFGGMLLLLLYLSLLEKIEKRSDSAE